MSVAPTTAEEGSARLAVTVFPLVIIVSAVIGYVFSDQAALLAPGITPLLGVVMFGMGLTLTLPDLTLVVRRPLPVIIGVVAQYLIMPLGGLAVAWALGLEPLLAAGLILLGCAPGGTASNVIAYLARADVALSVAMTSISTLLAPILTPLLMLYLAGAYLEIDAGPMALSILQVVLLPVLGGLVVRLLLPRVITRLLPVLPWVSVAAISVIVAAVVSGSAERVLSAGPIVFLAVALHNAFGFGLGYVMAKVLGTSPTVARTVSIEVGMQNSALAAGLATRYIDPVAALPSAVAAIWHNIAGSILATVFRRAASRESLSGEAPPQMTS
ncbi:MAG: bile acid:sodium symporter family protein [Mobilicoccus sp.]|nr:bile acid:sodium symporter family protein [Mobilicoccus sp.]